LGQDIIANPDFKDVAQQEDGVGHAGLQVALPSGKGLRL